jgi:putative Holliday junction resolvase
LGRILALDYGRRRIGVAVSDPLGITAQPLETWEGLQFNQIIEKVLALIHKLEIDKIIMGLPLTLKGDRGEWAREVEWIALKLKAFTETPILLWDERFTSVQAERFLHQLEEKPSRHKKKVDAIAAVLLLQNYLDSQKGMKIENKGETV